MLGFAGWYDTHDGFSCFKFYFPFDNVIWMGLLLYFYFLSLTNTDFTVEKKHRKHFVLPVAWLLLIAGKFIVDFVFNVPFPVNEKTQYGTKGPVADLDKNGWSGLISYILFFYYLFITIRSFSSYQQYVKKIFRLQKKSVSTGCKIFYMLLQIIFFHSVLIGVYLWPTLAQFFKDARLFILPHIIPAKIAAIHGNIYTSWQGLCKSQCTTEIK